ncbi:putative ubiquitin carboxyl-terminal esterase L3 [Blattamonas nauphoetae]|uniref:Ubiquitin carboxyl-terminal hydrolase n=1 Tax=Blattamonas nauphoetae TaxID=2049346 RepID=A0ABQ9Y1V6_9EUKA|nr:putative ubiquitin carboxyl-terminal esterase L3 [Blattamonas nauphoetae]
MLCFPCSKASIAPTQPDTPEVISHPLFFAKQTVGNACGTFALVHALSNLPLLVKEESFMSSFIAENRHQPPLQRGYNVTQSETLKMLHDQFCSEGAQSSIDTGVEHHYSTFLIHNNHLFELDGRKPGPIDFGDCSENQLFERAILEMNTRNKTLREDQFFSVISLKSSESLL